jgi:hypothetical protein
MSRLHYLHPQALDPLPQNLTTDVCIYGANSAGVVAALQLAKLKKKCILVEPSLHLGGLSAGGLSLSDFGRKEVIGGLSREFYQRVGKAYDKPEEWNFEPHIAERVFEEMVTEAFNLAEVRVFKPQLLKSVEMNGKRITSITMFSGLTVKAKVFIDCSYEGDLMAMAKISFHVGRESNDTYKETLNGAQVRDKHQFDRPVSPYKVDGDAASGLLPGIDAKPPTIGAGDHRVQAYNFRLCLTQEKANQIPFDKPPGYKPETYELLARLLAAGWDQTQRKFDPIQGKKVDKNNHGPVSTDFIGGNYDYPNADYKRREEIFQAHVNWQKGIMFFFANDARVPEKIREWQASWGLCKDEFGDCAGWSHALYVREARRMVSDYVMLEQDCKSERVAEDPIGMGSYNMDSHNCSRFDDNGQVKNDGDVQVGLKKPYAISYRTIVPKKGECENLFVPVCCSSSHIAYGSIRMEPVFMVLAQSAATAAHAAIEGNTSVQAVDYPALKKMLLDQGQTLTAPTTQPATQPAKPTP